MTQSATELLFDRASEELLIGCALVEPAEIDEMLALLSPAHFYTVRASEAWKALANLRAAGIPGDEINEQVLIHQLAAQGVNTDGFADYLRGTWQDLPSAYAWKRHAEILLDHWRRREGVRSGLELVDRLKAPGADPSHVLSRAAGELVDLAAARQNNDPRRIDACVREAMTAASSGTDAGLLSPWPSLNRITTGWKPGQLIVVAAATGAGKSSFAHQVAAHNLGAGVLVFSMEMAAPEVAERIVCTMAGVSSRDHLAGRLTPDEQAALNHAARGLSGNLWIDDCGSLDVSSIRAKGLRWVAKHGVGLIVVDYLQLVDEPSERGVTEATRIGSIARGLKLLAMEAGVPVIALSQLSREHEKQKRPPRLHDLRDSGAIEQHANQVILLHRTQEGPVETHEINVAKNRSGPVNRIDLAFRRACTRFEEINRHA